MNNIYIKGVYDYCVCVCEREWVTDRYCFYAIILAHDKKDNGLFQLIGIHPHGGVNFDLPPRKLNY